MYDTSEAVYEPETGCYYYPENNGEQFGIGPSDDGLGWYILDGQGNSADVWPPRAYTDREEALRAAALCYSY